MRSAPLHRDEPSLEDRLAQLDQQLRRFETSLRTQQQSHVRVRDSSSNWLRSSSGGGLSSPSWPAWAIRCARRRTRRLEMRSRNRSSAPVSSNSAVLADSKPTARHPGRATSRRRAEACIDVFDDALRASWPRPPATSATRRRSSKRVRRSRLWHRTSGRGGEVAVGASCGSADPRGAGRVFPRREHARDASSRAAAAERQAYEIQWESTRQIESMNRTAHRRMLKHWRRWRAQSGCSWCWLRRISTAPDAWGCAWRWRPLVRPTGSLCAASS